MFLGIGSSGQYYKNTTSEITTHQRRCLWCASIDISIALYAVVITTAWFFIIWATAWLWFLLNRSSLRVRWISIASWKSSPGFWLLLSRLHKKKKKMKRWRKVMNTKMKISKMIDRKILSGFFGQKFFALRRLSSCFAFLHSIGCWGGQEVTQISKNQDVTCSFPA